MLSDIGINPRLDPSRIHHNYEKSSANISRKTIKIEHEAEVTRTACPDCMLTFLTKEDYFKHRHVHTDERYPMCDICLKRFSEQYQLEKHRKYEHFLWYVVCWYFSKLTFSKSCFRNTIRVSNSLDPDQAWHYVRPDMGPNCLQKLSADNTSRQRVKCYSEILHKKYEH